MAQVSVIADGIERVLKVGFRGESILDVALAAGIDVPYACKAASAAPVVRKCSMARCAWTPTSRWRNMR